MNDSLEYRLRSHLWALAEPRNPDFHLQAHLKARNYLSEVLRQQGRGVVQQSFETADAGHGVNLIGESVEPSQVLLVAHYDTVTDSPGADDNGSAVAVALEVAARCPKVEVLLPDLEETGLWGSRHYVAKLTHPPKLTVVLESVGFWTDLPHSQSVPKFFPQAFPEVHAQLERRDFRGDFLALLHLTPDDEAADRLATTLTLPTLRVPIAPHSLSGPAAEQLSDFGRSDHLAFWEQGHPCLMLTDTANFRNPNYHLPSDTVETLDFHRMATLVEGLAAFFNG